ncbi:hypothetical protein IAT38_001511 [Cryptococcus sp. DSM 104549]
MASSDPTKAPPGATAFTTPTKRAIFSSSADAGPSRPRPTGASPAYSSRRHSLYGIEDRVVLDLGSRIWKVGFSGEPDPRAVFFSQDPTSPHASSEAWDLDIEALHGVRGSRSEGDRLVGVRVVRMLRETFVKHLLSDSKQRKVVVAENTFLPTFVKDHIARTLFDNLRVPSVSFTPSSLLALGACGRITGLVVDVGWLETSITPVYHSRPLYALARSTPLAGRRLHTRLRALLHQHATYIAPPTSMSAILAREKVQGASMALLTDRVVERVLTEGCFVGGVMLEGEEGMEDDAMDVDEPEGKPEDQAIPGENAGLIRGLKKRYAPTSTAKPMSFRVLPPGASTDMGYGTLIVPGWVRERAAEVLFEDDDETEGEGIPHAVLAALLKLPIDLRATLIESILVTGGTASLPNFIPRLRISLLQALLPPAPSSTFSIPPQPPSASSATPSPSSLLNTPAARAQEARTWRRRAAEPWSALYGLVDRVAVINDPAPVDGGEAMGVESGKGGKAPRWVPGLMAWVGGSLAGALRTGAPELTRETYDTLIATSIARGETYRDELAASEGAVAAAVGAG